MKYLPLIGLKPAEMTALEELPEKDKDLLVPVLSLRRWVGSNDISRSIERIHQAFGSRRAFLELTDEVMPGGSDRRPVHDSIEELRSPGDGYSSWFDFLSSTDGERFIPMLQLDDPAQFSQQMSRVLALGRGYGVRLAREAIGGLSDAVVSRIASVAGRGEGATVIFDVGKIDRALIDNQDFVLSLARGVNFASDILPDAALVLMASSFPDGFTALDSQEILERTLHAKVTKLVKVPAKLIYGDYGGVRAEELSGGAGAPAPRIDYATFDRWHFFRQAVDSRSARLSAYASQAQKLISSGVWVKGLKLWGCQMIERVAEGDETGASSAQKATAARVNIHLHCQINFHDRDAFMDTDEDWVG